MNQGRAADTLVVRADGSYWRRYVAPGQAPVTDSGRWAVERVTGEALIGFENFAPRWQSETFPGVPGLPGARGLWPVAAERTLAGTVKLPVNDDLGWAYIRVREP
jgi:hypothetical protein